MNARALVVLLAILLAGASFGCGGSGDGEPDARDSEVRSADSDETADGGRGRGDEDGEGDGEGNGDGDGDGAEAAADGDDETGDVEDEEPTTNNEVLLGAQFFGEQPARFGVVAVGDTRTIAFDVKAFGEARRIVGVSLAGDAAAEFRLDPGTCTVGAEVSRGASCTLRVTFAPAVDGIREAALRIDIEPGVSGGRSLQGGGAAPTSAATQSRPTEGEAEPGAAAPEPPPTTTGAGSEDGDAPPAPGMAPGPDAP